MEKQRHADGCLLHTELKALKEYLNPLKRTVLGFCYKSYEKSVFRGLR